MSQDPFQRDSNVPLNASVDTSPPPPKKRRTWLRIIVTLLAGGFLTLLVCCGAGAYFVQNYGSFIFDPMRKELNQVAELHQEVGEIESLNMNFFATVEEGKTNPEYVILDGESETGPFQLSVKMANSGELEKVFLVMQDGSRKPIDTTETLDAKSGENAARVPAENTDEQATGKSEAESKKASESAGEEPTEP